MSRSLNEFLSEQNPEMVARADVRAKEILSSMNDVEMLYSFIRDHEADLLRFLGTLGFNTNNLNLLDKIQKGLFRRPTMYGLKGYKYISRLEQFAEKSWFQILIKETAVELILTCDLLTPNVDQVFTDITTVLEIRRRK